jgi:hypothetical protein
MVINYQSIVDLADERGITPFERGTMVAPAWRSSYETGPDVYITNELNTPDPKDPSEIIAVRLTDTFPYGGKIGTLFSHSPIFFRDTVHFTLNGPVSSHVYGNWDNKKYAVLVPLDKLVETVGKGRISGLRPEDTWVLGDIELPENSLVIANASIPPGTDVGKAELQLGYDTDTQKPYYVEDMHPLWDTHHDEQLSNFESQGHIVTGVDIENGMIYLQRKEMEGLSPIRAAAYGAVVDMGYYPMGIGNHGWNGDGHDNIYEGFNDLSSLIMAMGLPDTTRAAHGSTWMRKLESQSFEPLERFWSYGDATEFENIVRKNVPVEYKEYVKSRFMSVTDRFKGREAEIQSDIAAVRKAGPQHVDRL